MNAFVKYIVNIIISFIKRMLYNMKVTKLKSEIQTKRKEMEDAKTKSDKLVDDFESEYKLFLEEFGAEDISGDSDAGAPDNDCSSACERVQKCTKEVCSGGVGSKDDD